MIEKFWPCAFLVEFHLSTLGLGVANPDCASAVSQRCAVSRDYVRFERSVIRKVHNQPETGLCEFLSYYPACYLGGSGSIWIKLEKASNRRDKRHAIIRHNDSQSIRLRRADPRTTEPVVPRKRASESLVVDAVDAEVFDFEEFLDVVVEPLDDVHDATDVAAAEISGEAELGVIGHTFNHARTLASYG
jgi:hypothetical protein